MVTGKVKFQNYNYGRWFNTPQELAEYEKKVAMEAARTQARAEISKQIEAVRLEVKKALDEKKELDKQMEHFVQMNTIQSQTMIDDYKNQIARLSLALDIVTKSQRTSKIELVEQWKREHPFTKLKELQNKQYNLERKRERL